MGFIHIYMGIYGGGTGTAPLTQPNVCVKVEIHKHRAKTEGKLQAKVEIHKHRAKVDDR